MIDASPHEAAEYESDGVEEKGAARDEKPPDGTLRLWQKGTTSSQLKIRAKSAKYAPS
jgi:hypothetical protein